jgi:hypothetical protein
VLYDSGVLVGNMFELLLRADIAQRKDPLGGGPLIVVDDYEPIVVHLDPGKRQVERVAVWGPAGGDQQNLCLKTFLLASL